MDSQENMTIRPKKVEPVDLGYLAERLECEIIGTEKPVFVTGVTLDSRDVKPGDLYVGMPGSKRHGADFAEQVQELGAVAILTDYKGLEKMRELPQHNQHLPVLLTKKNPRLILGKTAALIYKTRDPDLKLFGITGTNGKTSVLYILDTLMNVAGMRTAISTTAERRIGDTTVESTLTSPEASELHAFLARIVEEGIAGVGLEISAQAVVRHRIDGVLFDVVAFNNFSQDHLDEFGDMESYFQAKLELFNPRHAKKGVVVVDTPAGRKIVKNSKIPITTMATEYGQTADWHLAITRQNIDGVSFVLQGPDNSYFRGSVPLFGAFMAENAALALIMLHEAGLNLQKISDAIGSAPIPVKIPGRLELVSSLGAGPRFYVDYGHTPGSFASIFDALSEVKTGRVIFMFGADGDRDTTKREEMGRIASEGSDVLIICDYHPRFEEPGAIRAQLLAGAHTATRPAEILEIADPREALRYAIKIASKEDIIIYAGPGHETYQEVAGNMIPYSARDEVRGALREAGY
ncbi:MAG TPA: UDP-N-acetylmuramoyl-L-alanyl-D-glutamate--2,6-diaminopimelate ligase [Microbacteriaceae bacterium]|nr:UDP-N-acetylmuramoyl-L-alanyl-D-glutamate--2,6-diaminopimelate ligase [Microbacteriaceae bacterium]